MSERIEVDGAKPADSGRVDVRSAIARAIGCGYSRGHQDTMNGCYTDVGYEDRVAYHGALADDLLTGDADFAALAAQGQGEFYWRNYVKLMTEVIEAGSGMIVVDEDMHKLAAAINATRPLASPAGVPDGCMVVPLLKPEEMQALRRFAETTEDDESYDVPKDMMAFLSINGAVTRSATKKDWFWLTDYGRMLLAAPSAPESNT